jgi:hypothetical protein
MRHRVWQSQQQRVIMANGEPLTIRAGEYVVVTVVDDFDEAAAVMRCLEQSKRDQGKR